MVFVLQQKATFRWLFLCSNKEFSFHRFSCGAADSKEDQHSADEHERNERVNRPNQAVRETEQEKKKNDLGILGNMEVGFMVSDNYDGTFTINTSTTGIFDRIDEAEFIINFCPICGRDLRSEENERN